MGTDWVALERFRSLLMDHRERFLERCFRPKDVVWEVAEEKPGTLPTPTAVAVSWAAKEAFLKSLDSDVKRLPYRDIVLVRGADGRLELALHGAAREAWARTRARTLKVTVSSTETRAQAWVVLED